MPFAPSEWIAIAGHDSLLLRVEGAGADPARCLLSAARGRRPTRVLHRRSRPELHAPGASRAGVSGADGARSRSDSAGTSRRSHPSRCRRRSSPTCRCWPPIATSTSRRSASSSPSVSARARCGGGRVALRPLLAAVAAHRLIAICVLASATARGVPQHDSRSTRHCSRIIRPTSSTTDSRSSTRRPVAATTRFARWKAPSGRRTGSSSCTSCTTNSFSPTSTGRRAICAPRASPPRPGSSRHRTRSSRVPPRRASRGSISPICASARATRRLPPPRAPRLRPRTRSRTALREHWLDFARATPRRSCSATSSNTRTTCVAWSLLAASRNATVHPNSRGSASSARRRWGPRLSAAQLRGWPACG